MQGAFKHDVHLRFRKCFAEQNDTSKPCTEHPVAGHTGWPTPLVKCGTAWLTTCAVGALHLAHSSNKGVSRQPQCIQTGLTTCMHAGRAVAGLLPAGKLCYDIKVHTCTSTAVVNTAAGTFNNLVFETPLQQSFQRYFLGMLINNKFETDQGHVACSTHSEEALLAATTGLLTVWPLAHSRLQRLNHMYLQTCAAHAVPDTAVQNLPGQEARRGPIIRWRTGHPPRQCPC